MPYQLIDDNESALGTLGRGALRTAARAGEALVGAPGDIAKGVLGLGNLATKAVTGSEIPGAASLAGYIPGSEAIKKNVTENLTGDYLNPQGAVEETIDSIVGDVASLIAPGGLFTSGSRAALTGLAKGGLKAGAQTVGKQALRAAGAHGAGVLAETLTDSPLIGGAVKIGTLLASSTAGGRKALKEIQNNSYTQAEKLVGTKDSVNAGSLVKDINKAKKVLSKGDLADKGFIMQRLEATENAIQKNGKINIKNAIELRKNVNDWIYNQDISGHSKRYLGDLRDNLNKTIDTYGKKNPAFKELFDLGDDITRGMKAGGQIQQFLNKNLTIQKAFQHYKPLSYGAGGLFYLLGKPHSLLALSAGIPGAAASKYIGQTYNLIKNSPEAAKYYKKALQAALNNDATAFAKSVKAFDKVAAQQLPNEQSSNQARYELVG